MNIELRKEKMPRGENILEIGHETRYKSFEDIKEKTYPRPFSVKLPVSVAESLLDLPTKERTLLIRRAIINEVKKFKINKEHCH